MDLRFGETIMAGMCIVCLVPYSDCLCTQYNDSGFRAREAELNSGRQEKLPFAQLVLKPTIAENASGNAYPGNLSEAGKPGYYNIKYGVYVPAGGKIKVESALAPGWYIVIAYSKEGIIHSTKNMRESEIAVIAKKYADIDPSNKKIKPSFSLDLDEYQ